MFSRDLGVDLGTSSVLVWSRGRGIVVREPCLVARAKATGEPKAFGTEAATMVGRTPVTIEVIQPLRCGAVASFTATEALLRHVFALANGKLTLGRPRVVVGVPSEITGVERQAVLDACRGAGAREAFPLETPMAAALGLGIGVGEPDGNLVVDVGSGTTNVAVIALGGIVTSAGVRVGGLHLDEAIHRYVKRAHGLLLGERTAEEIKIAIGSAHPLVPELSLAVRGRDLAHALPREITLTSEEVREALHEPLEQILACVRAVIERTPPELVNDIARNGVWLAGGSARLRALTERIEAEIGLPAHLPDAPEVAVINGLGRALDQIEALGETHVPVTR